MDAAGRPFIVCVHDATPAYARQTERLIADLAPLLGRRFSFAVVPNWRGAWPLAAHPDYSRLVRASADELLLHGYCHRRRRGWGAVTLLAEGSDEMNGLDDDATRHLLDLGQRAFSDAFGTRARGFLPPAWQWGHLRLGPDQMRGVEHLLGFFSLESRNGVRVRLATMTWDCGRWGWLGHIGEGVGRLLQLSDCRVPVLAIHPRDVERGFWPGILRATHTFLDRGYHPTTPAALLETFDAERAV